MAKLELLNVDKYDSMEGISRHIEIPSLSSREDLWPGDVVKVVSLMRKESSSDHEKTSFQPLHVRLMFSFADGSYEGVLLDSENYGTWMTFRPENIFQIERSSSIGKKPHDQT